MPQAAYAHAYPADGILCAGGSMPVRILLLVGALLPGVTGRAVADAPVFTDPAPPAVAALDRVDPPVAKETPELSFHAAPRALPAGAITQDWPQFLGPDHNNVSRETKLLDAFTPAGPPRVWEYEKGSGYGGPAVAGDRLVLLHRVKDDEVVDCLHPQTGKRYWRHSDPTSYQDRYGFNDGPRGTPAIAADADSVVTFGVEGRLLCLELSTGRERWRRDVLKEFKLRQNFFGVGSSPLIDDGKVIVNVGAEPGGPCVAAFDLKTGKLLWGAGKEWGPSYASPIPATFHGRRRLLVFAGGESDPPTGGLLGIDPADGRVAFSFPWRGTRRESVNASSPLVVSGDRILVSESYGSGGALLHVKPDGSLETVWTNPAFGTHFMSAVEHGGHLYGVDGHGPNDAFLVCVETATGKEVWRSQPEWKETVEGRGGRPAREMTLGTYRCWLTPVDGGKRFLCLGEFGHLLWMTLSPEGARVTSRSRLFLADETWTPPVVSRGLLYVCQNVQDRSTRAEPRLSCYDLRSAAPAPPP
jgi:outer membrane protein assembly factor BamB